MKVSLQDFGFNQPGAPEINTPRSLEACKREGIQPKEIVKMTLEEFSKQHKMSGLDLKGIELFYKHFEEKREEKFKDLVKQRYLVLEDEKLGQWSADGASKSKMVSKYANQGTSSLIEKEKAQLEKIKKRQQKEIESMMEYELKMQEIRQQNEKKVEEERQKQIQREQELQKKRAEQEELKRQRDLQKQLKFEQEQRELLEIQRQMELKEKERQKLEEQKLKAREEEQKQKEEEKRLQIEKQRLQNEENIRIQIEANEKKRKEMEEKERIRKIQLEEQKKKKAEESELIRKENEERIRQAKEKNEAEIQRQREEMEKKIQISEQKRIQFEEEKRKKLEQDRIEAEKHAEIIRKVIEQNEQMEMEKKKEYLKKIDEAEFRKKQIELEQEKEKQIKKQQEKEKELQRQSIFTNMETKQKQRIDEFLSKFKEKEENLQKIQLERSVMITDKRNNVTLKRLDKRENVDRIMRKQEYDRYKLSEKLKEKMERADKLQQDLGQLLEQRQLMRMEIDKQKRDIVLKLEKVREGKLPPLELQKQLGITDPKLITQYEQPSIPRKSQSQGKNQPKQQNVRDKNFETLKPDQLKKMDPPAETYKTEAKQPESIFYHQKKIKAAKRTPKKKKISEQDTKINEAVLTPEVLKQMNDMLQKNNGEMMRVLMEEQQNENKRDERYRNSKDRTKLEKTMSIERAKAQLRIQKLQDQHDQELLDFKKKYNI